ncbi:cdc42 effector protein 5 [Pseudophryne corroboree]|uniref:cdc42 effector protein 5 n=1 Tax=Pseudophryne corroboree TaxID=495146 RepID=UPI003081B3ED
MPILKQSSSHSKKRTRIDREMISAPLGDFRHTMHVGRGGDVFGDTSFLSNHGPASPPPAEVPTSKKNGLMKLAGTGDHEEAKMSDSLSQRSQSSGIGSGAGSVSSSPVNNVSSKEDSLWNNSCAGGNTDQLDWLSPGRDCGLKHAESMLSFHLDLGPSILDEVLGVMDRDPPSSEWSSPDDQCDLGFKFSSVSTTVNEKHTQSSSTIEPHSLPSTLPITNPGLDYNSSTTSENPDRNGSIDEEDSEEEKRSIYEGIADSPEQHDGSLHIRHHAELDDDDDDDDEEEVGQGYTFDEDLDDEIGV